MGISFIVVAILGIVVFALILMVVLAVLKWSFKTLFNKK